MSKAKKSAAAKKPTATKRAAPTRARRISDRQRQQVHAQKLRTHEEKVAAAERLEKKRARAAEVQAELSVKKQGKPLTKKQRAKLNAKLVEPPNHDVVALSAGKPVARTVADSTKPTAPADPAHPLFVDAHMNVFIHVREGRAADYFLTLDGGTYKVKRIAADDPARKHWRPYVGPSTRAAAAAIYERSFLPKTAEAARVICELQGKSITDLDKATRQRLLSGASAHDLEQPTNDEGDTMATKKAKSKTAAKPTKATTAKPAATNGDAKAKVPGARMNGLPPYTLETKVEWLVKENPRREGSETHANWKRYFGAKTVGELFKRGGFPGQLRWDLKHGYLKLSK